MTENHSHISSPRLPLRHVVVTHLAGVTVLAKSLPYSNCWLQIQVHTQLPAVGTAAAWLQTRVAHRS